MTKKSRSHGASGEETVQIGAMLIVWPLLNGFEEVSIGP